MACHVTSLLYKQVPQQKNLIEPLTGFSMALPICTLQPITEEYVLYVWQSDGKEEGEIRNYYINRIKRGSVSRVDAGCRAECCRSHVMLNTLVDA
jgi:hypothetical protein